MSTDLTFSIGDYVVYPNHGVGRIVSIETQQIAGHELKLFIISFDNDRMKLSLPITKARNSGLRPLSSGTVMEQALKTVQGKAKVRRAMWSRRAQEYELKINSGNPISIAEVIRDLHRSSEQPEQSYSERQLYEAALERLTREIAAIENIDQNQAVERLQGVLKAA